jgi:hypothetical protein
MDRIVGVDGAKVLGPDGAGQGHDRQQTGADGEHESFHTSSDVSSAGGTPTASTSSLADGGVAAMTGP